jgi:uncharacterized membrane protein YgcG
MRKIYSLLVCSIILVLLAFFPVKGLGQSVDRQPVIDDAGIFGNRMDEVEAAAAKLSDKGADVRVRTISTYGSAGNLDRYEVQLEQDSPSWLDSEGNIKNNLIVLIVSFQERQMGLYYGAYWKNLLDPNWLRIQTDILKPRFQDSDYAGGVVQGLEEIQRLIQSKGQTQPVSSTAMVQPQPVTQPAKGRSNGWIIPVVIVVILGLIIGLLLFLSNRKNLSRRQAARQKAMLSKQGSASGINELIEAVQLLEIKVNVTADRISPAEAETLRDGLEKARGLVNQSSQTYSELSHSAGDPENPRLRETELGVIDAEYQKILVNLRLAREAIKGVEDHIVVIQQIIDSFPGKATEVNMAAENALREQEQLKRTGFKTTYPAELVVKGRGMLEQAKALVSEKRFLEAVKYVNLASNQINQAVQAGQELPRKKQEAEAAIPALAARIEQVKDIINAGRLVFERIFQEYAETTWASVRGNGTEAENRINWVLDALDDAKVASGMEQQEWHQAVELVNKGNNWLTEAESLMKSISELEVNLIAARRDAPNEISAAQADVTKDWEYIHQFDEDIRESLEDDLHAAEKKNDLAREELNKEKPDYFNVNKLAREANEAADKILIQARSEHEEAERLRAKAASTRRDANARVAIAGKYVEVHHPVVQQEARGYLNNAVEALRQADIAVDVNAQISLALQAESAAERAYSLAQQDVNRSNIVIPRISPPIIIIPPTGRSPGGNPSWGSSRPSSSSSSHNIRPGGGGSSGWGSRAGGSSGGGGSHRGGGSTGW